MSAPATVLNAAADNGLRSDAIGFREVLFQSITAMAPGAAIAASIPFGAGFAGGSLPLAVIIALIACLLTAYSIGELARHIPAAGSFATYASQSLHPTIGFIVAWGYVFVEALVPSLLFLQLGFTAAPTIHQEWHAYPANLWWPWAMAGLLIVGVVGYLGVTTSARMGTILGAFEIVVFLILGFVFIVKAGGHNTLSVFGTGHTPKATHGITGIIAGTVYTVLAFSGFEAAAPLAEEAKAPEKTVRRAILGATLGIGLVYIFTTYAVDVFFGDNKFAGFSTAGAASWQGLARSSFGLYWILIFIAILNSCVANANAGTNVSTRMSYAMGRIGVFPRGLAQVNSHRSPSVAVITQSVLSIAVTLGLGFKYGPTSAFGLIATMIVVVVVGVYIIMNLSCLTYYARHRITDFHPVSHLLIPLLGIAAFVPALLASAGIKIASWVSALTYPSSLAGPIVGVWLVLGLIYLGYQQSKNPDRIRAISEVHLMTGEVPDELAAVLTPAAGAD